MIIEETRHILSILRVNYPGTFNSYSKEDTQIYLNLWDSSFKNYSYTEVANAVNYIIQTDTREFAPNIALVKSIINKKFKDNVMPDEKAWSIVLANAKCDRAEARKRYDSLPGNIRKAVEDSNFLSMLGTSNSYSQEKLKKQFLEKYHNVIEKDIQELNANKITRLEFCQRNNIPKDTIKFLLPGIENTGFLESSGTKKLIA